MKDKKKIIGGTLVSIIILILLFQFVESNDIVDTFKKVDSNLLIIAFILYFISNTLKSLRFHSVFKKRITFVKMFWIVSMGNFFAQLIPMRVGEISFIYLFKKTKKSSITEATAVILLARFYDVVSIILILLVSVFFIGELSTILVDYITLSSTILVIFLLIFVLSLANLKKIYYGIAKIAKFLRINKLTPKFAIKFYKNFKKSGPIVKSKKNHIVFFLYSILIWLTQYYFYYSIVTLIGWDFGFINVIISSSMASIGFLIPIHTVANIGPFEGMWAASLILFGFSKSIAISSGFLIHGIQVLFVVIFGACGFLASGIYKLKKPIL